MERTLEYDAAEGGEKVETAQQQPAPAVSVASPQRSSEQPTTYAGMEVPPADAPYRGGNLPGEAGSSGLKSEPTTIGSSGSDVIQQQQQQQTDAGSQDSRDEPTTYAGMDVPPADAPYRGGNLPGEAGSSGLKSEHTNVETGGTDVIEQEQQPQTEQLQQEPVAYTRTVTTEVHNVPDDQSNTSDMPTGASSADTTTVDAGNVSDEEESNSKEPVVHIQRDDAETMKIKLAENEIVREFEARREAYYKDQFRNHVTYWTALGDMMHGHSAATAQVLDYYGRRNAAYKSFAESLFSLNDTVSGDKSGATKGLSRKGELFSNRAETLQAKHEKKGSTKPLGAAGASKGDGHLIDELCGMDCEAAREIDMFTDTNDTAGRAKLAATHEQSDAETAAILKEGDQALNTLKSIDAYTLKAYENRHRAAYESIVRPTEYMSNSSNSNDTTPSGNKRTTQASEIGDQWLADMNYRVAVRQQKDAWDNLSTILAKLFDRLRDIELNRRLVSKQVIEETIGRQNTLFGRLPQTHSGALACLGNFNLDPQGLEKDIKEEVRIASKNPELMSPSHDALGEETAPRAADDSFINTLPPPLESPFIVHKSVIERKDKGVLTSTWVPALAILTADLYMHLFDCPKTNVGSDPKVAFDSVLPTIEVADRFRASKEEKKAMITPTMSLDLSSHIVGRRAKQTKEQHERSFHVIEVKQNSGFKGLFKNESQYKASLRAGSEAQMHEWISKIESLANSSTPISGINNPV